MNWEKLIEAEKALGLHDRANLALRVKWADEIRAAPKTDLAPRWFPTWMSHLRLWRNGCKLLPN